MDFVKCHLHPLCGVKLQLLGVANELHCGYGWSPSSYSRAHVTYGLVVWSEWCCHLLLQSPPLWSPPSCSLSLYLIALVVFMLKLSIDRFFSCTLSNKSYNCYCKSQHSSLHNCTCMCDCISGIFKNRSSFWVYSLV